MTSSLLVSMMKNKNHFDLRFLLAVPLCAVMFAFSFIGEPGNESVLNLFANKIFGRVSFYDNSAYIEVLQNLIFLVVGNILFSDMIARHFRTGCVYVFSRIHNRRKWYIRKAGSLLLHATLFTFCYLTGALMICIFTTEKTLSSDEINALLLIYVFAFLLSGSTSLLVNLLSTKWGTTIAITLVQFVILALVFVARLTCNYPTIFMLNPMSCLGILENPSSLGYVFASNLAVFFGVLFCGMRWIRKYDVFLLDAELS